MLLALLFAVPAALVAVLAWHRHTRKDWLLALSLFPYYPATLVYGSTVSVWPLNASPILLGVLLVHCAVAIWLSKSRLLVAAVTPLAIYSALVAVVVTEMSVNHVWF